MCVLPIFFISSLSLSLLLWHCTCFTKFESTQKSSTRQHLRLRYVRNNEIANFHHKIHDLFVFNTQITLLKNRFTLHVNGGNCLLLIRFITDYSIQLCLSLTLSILISCIPEERMRSTFVINAAITNCWCYNIKKYRIFKLNDASPLVLHNNCLSLLFFNSSVILVVMEQEEIKWPLFPFLVFFLILKATLISTSWNEKYFVHMKTMSFKNFYLIFNNLKSPLFFRVDLI